MLDLKLEIVTPNGLIFSDKVKEVVLPGEEGEFGVLPEHVGLFTLLGAGVIEFTKENSDTDAVVISSGNVTVYKDSIVALVEGAIPLEGKGEGDIAKALDGVRELLKDATDSQSVIASVEARLR
ncbi:ATP synthase, F1 epsilon subunit [Thiovulum sp. ES]|nr:ATP synthase, F1 epsilon subunit [Thiovulum sp. ES]